MCVGDCDGSGQVTINEIVILVDISLENLPPSACPFGDINHDGVVTIDEILKAVNNDLDGCS